ncbi:hypothetical protein CC78DRAFT_587726 [Lojkania enalia]|uniref:Uncharacterized protein n=1 Tax=Lojkania enalia TaxID=147567 RepID=A0A9P4MXX1_9PLEO|nr:hypothetical protein CC78DRAFT_587726 [Didymosphaeria enalia]
MAISTLYINESESIGLANSENAYVGPINFNAPQLWHPKPLHSPPYSPEQAQPSSSSTQPTHNTHAPNHPHSPPNLSEATLSAHNSYNSEHAQQEQAEEVPRIERLQAAAQSLGFSLPAKALQRSKRGIREWIKSQGRGTQEHHSTRHPIPSQANKGGKSPQEEAPQEDAQHRFDDLDLPPRSNVLTACVLLTHNNSISRSAWARDERVRPERLQAAARSLEVELPKAFLRGREVI